MTGNSNGVVALYDLGKGGSKLERLKTHHPSGRAVNVVSFAGPSGQGTLLASGCQDGDIKLSVSLLAGSSTHAYGMTKLIHILGCSPCVHNYLSNTPQSDSGTMLCAST